jgi:hypothetical protein
MAAESVPAACEPACPSTEACEADESPASEDLTVEQPDPGDENFEEDTEPSDAG